MEAEKYPELELQGHLDPSVLWINLVDVPSHEMGSKKYVYMLRIPAIRILCEKINANETTTAQMIKNAALMVVITIVSLKIPTKNMVAIVQFLWILHLLLAHLGALVAVVIGFAC